MIIGVNSGIIPDTNVLNDGDAIVLELSDPFLVNIGFMFRFRLAFGDGNGNGYGNGDGNGNGYGEGNDDGFGNGFGYDLRAELPSYDLRKELFRSI